MSLTTGLAALGAIGVLIGGKEVLEKYLEDYNLSPLARTIIKTLIKTPEEWEQYDTNTLLVKMGNKQSKLKFLRGVAFQPEAAVEIRFSFWERLLLRRAINNWLVWNKMQLALRLESALLA